MQEEQALTNAPERSSAEFIRTGSSLVNAIGQSRTHMVYGDIRVRLIGGVRHRAVMGLARGEVGGVAQDTADSVEQSGAIHF